MCVCERASKRSRVRERERDISVSEKETFGKVRRKRHLGHQRGGAQESDKGICEEPKRERGRARER